MAFGESLRLRMLDIKNRRRTVKPLPASSRDRTLPGKKRVKARKEQNRRLAQGDWT